MVLTHGGAGSNGAFSDGTLIAARKASRLLKEGAGALAAACAAVEVLEDDPRFNAGTGSCLREDGETIEMDAACMGSKEGFGAVACLREVRFPIRAARAVVDAGQNVICGSGAALLADRLDLEKAELITERARKDFEKKAERGDTVGAVVFDGNHFAAALSSGGITACPIGRIGDVPIPGAGLWAGPAGAVACTGDGDVITRERAARRIYGFLEAGRSCDDALEESLAWFEGVSFGVLAVTAKDSGSRCTRDMAWSAST